MSIPGVTDTAADGNFGVLTAGTFSCPEATSINIIGECSEANIFNLLNCDYASIVDLANCTTGSITTLTSTDIISNALKLNYESFQLTIQASPLNSSFILNLPADPGTQGQSLIWGSSQLFWQNVKNPDLLFVVSADTITDLTTLPNQSVYVSGTQNQTINIPDTSFSGFEYTITSNTTGTVTITSNSTNLTTLSTGTVMILTYIQNLSGWSITYLPPLAAVWSNNILALNSSINATSPTTGSITTTGGVGISQDLWVGGAINANNIVANSKLVASNNLYATSAFFSSLAIEAMSPYGTITSIYSNPLSIGNQVTLAIGQDSSTNNSFNISYIPYAYNSPLNALSIQNQNQFLLSVLANGQVLIPSNIPSTSPTTGTLIVTGGVGITGITNISSSVSSYSTSVLNVINTNTTPDAVATFFAPNAIGGNTSIALGVADTSLDSLYLGFNYTSSGSTSNYAYLALPSVPTNAIQISSTSISIPYSTISTSATTGCLLLAGGLGMLGSLFNSSGILQVYNATNPFISVGLTSSLTSDYIQFGVASIAGGFTIDSQIGDGIIRTAGSLFLGSYGSLGSQTVQIQLSSNGNTYIYGNTFLTNTTTSTSPTTGTLVVTGGTGISGSVFLGSTLSVAGITSITNTTPSISPTTGCLVLSGGLGVTGMTYLSASVSSYSFSVLNVINTYTSPLTVATFFAPNTTNGNISLGIGVDDQNYNSLYIGLNFTSSSSLSNYAYLTLPGVSTNALEIFSDYVSIPYTTTSTSPTTGALVVSGGTGISGPVFLATTLSVAGITSITNTTASTSSTTGCLVLSGGLGVSGETNIANITNITSSVSSYSTSVLNVINTNTTPDTVATFFAPNAIGGNTSIALGVADSNYNCLYLGFNYTSSSSLSNYAYLTLPGSSNALEIFSDYLSIPYTTNSSSSTTGALVISGGLGINGSQFISSTSTGTSLPILSLTNNATVNGTYMETSLAPSLSTSSSIYRNFGVAQSLNNSIVDYFQYAGSSSTSNLYGLAFWGTTPFLTATPQTVEIPYTTNSTSTTTGAITTPGGAGIAGNVYIGGSLFVGGLSVITQTRTTFTPTIAAGSGTFSVLNYVTQAGVLIQHGSCSMIQIQLIFKVSGGNANALYVDSIPSFNTYTDTFIPIGALSSLLGGGSVSYQAPNYVEPSGGHLFLYNDSFTQVALVGSAETITIYISICVPS